MFIYFLQDYFREVPVCSLIAAIFITVLLIMWYN